MLDQKTALITGASKGIGKAIAIQLAKDGFHIVLNYRSNEDLAKEVKKEIEDLGVKCFLAQADVTKIEDCQNIFDQAVEEFGKIDVLVNNAGITRDDLIMRMKEEDFDDVIEGNLKSAFLMCKVFSRHFMKNRRGRIINISSIVGLIGNPGQSNYAASKAGMIGLTKSLAKELGSRNILVNAVAPGFIVSDMTDQLSEEVQEKYAQVIPLRKFGQVEDVANVVSFLASDKSSYMTGQVLSVDGGLHM